MRRALLTAIMIFGAGCSLDRGESSFAPQDLVDASTPDVAQQADIAFGAGSGAGTMTGTWMLLHEASTCVLVDEQVTWATYIVEIEQNGRALTERRTQCEVSLSPVFGLAVTVPDRVLPTIEFVDVDLGIVSSLGESGTYSSSTEVSLWGLELDDPLNDPVPDEPDDPAVIDADEDGNPGLTFEVVGSDCERYITQRSIIRYSGSFTAPNQIDGKSTNVTDANVVGSSQALCGVSPRLTSNDPLSRFRMVRVDGAGESINLDADDNGDISCDEVLPFAESLIERRDADPANCN